MRQNQARRRQHKNAFPTITSLLFHFSKNSQLILKIASLFNFLISTFVVIYEILNVPFLKTYQEEALGTSTAVVAASPVLLLLVGARKSFRETVFPFPDFFPFFPVTILEIWKKN